MFNRSSKPHSRSASVNRNERNHVNATASATAHSAAAQAFLGTRASAPNLSASAAAAALRSMSPQPTNVSEVQTKRTLQRQASNGSSPGRGRGAPPLHRRGSSGSMTERTFRSPSPHRPDSRAGRGQAPPVPPVPQNYVDKPARSHRRTASLEPPPPRVLSPPLKRPAGRGQSLDRGANAVPRRPEPPKPPQLQDINELERSDSQNSINFSYPRNARPNSPPPRSPITSHTRGEHYMPKTMRSGALAAEASQVDPSAAAQAPVKKKKSLTKGSAEGSHFQDAGGNAPAAAASLQPAQRPLSPDTTAQSTPIRKKKKKPVAATGEISHFPQEAERPMSPSYTSDSDSTPETDPSKRNMRALGALNKQPSVVREDWEGEQTGQASVPHETDQRLEENISPVASPEGPLQSKKPLTAANVSRKIDEAPAPPKSLPPVHDSVTVLAPSEQPKPIQRLAVSDAPARTASLSPSRSTRFSDRLSSDLAAGYKHEPLPRSVSPAKSALKHQSPSPQARSPMDGSFPGHRRGSSQTPSDASDLESTVSADGTAPGMRKKKSVRVSFDSAPEVVGTANEAIPTDTPLMASSQSKDVSKKAWFGLGKSKNNTLGTIPAEDDMEEIMTPRPALPSFGSVRNKGRNTEHAPVQNRNISQHSEQQYASVSSYAATSTPSGSSDASNSSNDPTLDTSVSSDHAIGGLLAREASQAKAKQMVSSATYEPLPPEVTSREGTSYESDSESSVENEPEPSGSAPRPVDIAPAREEPVQSTSSQPIHEAVDTPSDSVPTIAVQPATPGIEQIESRDDYLVKLPGGFPASTEGLSKIPTPESEDAADAALASTSPAGLGLAEPPPAPPPGSSGAPESPVHALSLANLEKSHPPVERDSDNDSIYSDAAESQADLDDIGFGSIDAIVDSPVVPVSTFLSRQALQSPDSPTVQTATRPDASDRTTSWDNAQAHWSGLAQSYRQGIQQPQTRTSQEPDTALQVLQMGVEQPQTSMHQTEHPPQQPQSPVRHAKPPPQQPVSSTQQSGGTVPGKPRTKKVRAPGATAAALAAAAPTRSAFTDSRPSSPPSAGTQPKRSNLSSSPQVETRAGQAKPPPQPRGTLQKKRIPPGVIPAQNLRPAVSGVALGAAKAAPKTKPVPRTFSDDSDSESSFRKRRRAKSAGDGRFTMRHSMRGQSAEPARPTTAVAPAQRPVSPVLGQKSMRTSMRDQPAEPARPMSAGAPGHRALSPASGPKGMRASMRGSVDAGTPTMRGQPQAPTQRSSSLFGRSKAKAKSPVRPAGNTFVPSRIKSRLADSDDEDGSKSKTFRSRFEDSSDEEAPTKLRPVRGIPRKADEGESTDLDDSSDEDEEVAVEKPTRPLPIDTKAAPAVALSEPQSPASAQSDRKHRSFFSRFRTKKDKTASDPSRLGVGTIAERNAMLDKTRPNVEAARNQEHQSPPVKKPAEDKEHPSRLGFESIAERDAVIERTRQQLEEAKEAQDQVRDPVSPISTQKSQRATPQRIMSDTWPLPPSMPAAEEDRPMSHDGVNFAAPETNLRPGMSSRQNTSSTVRSKGGTPIYGRTGKKKKFPLLRKAFGLKD